MDEEFELEAILEDIKSITICGSDSINHGEMEVAEQEESMPDKKKVKDVGIGIYPLTNICGARFYQALLDIILKKMTEIIHREADKILSLTVGERFTINFDSLFNELLGECKDLMKEHKLVRKEIRRLLQIDAR